MIRTQKASSPALPDATSDLNLPVPSGLIVTLELSIAQAAVVEKGHATLFCVPELVTGMASVFES
jgi:hypothetical protein